MGKKTNGDDTIQSGPPFARLGAATVRNATVAGEPPHTVDALALVDLCRLLDVPAGLAVAVAPEDGAIAPDGDMDRAVKRELLELNRAYARIPDGNVRRTLLQLVKAAAAPH